MADKKISALPASSLPLAGTEVLPIVQSNVTVKVATNDLTVKNIRSNATTGILQVAGPAAAATRTMTTPDANFTVARTDAGQTFNGAQIVENGSGTNQRLIYLKQTNDFGFSFNLDSQSTGDLMLKSVNNGVEADILRASRVSGAVTVADNLVVGTAGKGIDFSANANAPGMTSELLDWYEEGNYTPTAANITGTNTYAGSYTRVGNRVFYEIVISTTTSIGITNGASTLTLPFTPNQYGTCLVGDVATGSVYGMGLSNTSFVYPPTVAAGTVIVITGSYRVA